MPSEAVSPERYVDTRPFLQSIMFLQPITYNRIHNSLFPEVIECSCAFRVGGVVQPRESSNVPSSNGATPLVRSERE